MTPRIPTFRLPDEFVAGYADKQPDWGPLGWITYKRTYARWADKACTRREEWFETVRRVVEGNIAMDPRIRTDAVQAELLEEAKEMFDTIFNLAWTPPGRGLWISGTDYARKHGDALVNCYFIAVRPEAYEGDESAKASFPFVVTADLLMKGSGVGFSVTRENVAQFPIIKTPLTLSIVCDDHHPNYGELDAGLIPQSTHTYISVEDSRRGWTDALRIVIDAHFKSSRDRNLVIDVSNVRGSGSEIKGFGGTAAGPGPLVKMLRAINDLLNDRVGGQISPVEATDMMNLIGRCVVAGNVRRCLPAGTRVWTERGSIPIDQLTIDDTVVTPAGHAPIRAIFDQGVQQTVLVKHAFGEFECTAGHRLAVFSDVHGYEFRRAGDLAEGDRLVWDAAGYDGIKTELPALAESVPKRHDTNGQALVLPELDEEIAWLIGLIHGDGYVFVPPDSAKTPNGYMSIACHEDDEPTIARASRALRRFGVRVHVRQHRDRCKKVNVYSNKLAEYLHAHVKRPNEPLRVPTWIENAPRAIRGAYLSGVFDADGHAGTRSGTMVLVSTSYREFAGEIQRLYASLGVAVRVRQSRAARGKWRALYNVTPKGLESYRGLVEPMKFALRCPEVPQPSRTQGGFSFSREMAEASYGRPRSVWAASSRSVTADRLEQATEFTAGRALPVPVREIVASGRSVQTYDIEVEGLHQFTAEGFVVHNSAEIGLGSSDDLAFISMKRNQEKLMAYRWASNNSIVIDNSFEDFERIGQAIAHNGEPGIFNIELSRTRLRLIDDASDERNLTVEGTNPCVTADTWILTDEGPRQVSELIGRPHGSIVDGNVFSTTEHGFWLTGSKPVLHLATREGYQLRLTANHQLLKVRSTRKTEHTEWVEAGELEPGDQIKLHDHRPLTGWDGAGTFDEGWLLGELLGDGTFGHDTAILDFWGESAPQMGALAVGAIHAEVGGRSDLTGHLTSTGKFRVGSTGLRDLAAEYDVVRGNKTITAAMQRSSSDFHCGLMRGLFDSDGSVVGDLTKGLSVRLSQADLHLLRSAQQMLLRLGIASSIYENRHAAGMRLMPDGEGGLAEFDCRATHELSISNDNIGRYAELIGFSEPAKQTKLAEALASCRRVPNRERFVVTVASLIEDGVEDVYDCTVPEVSCFDANGLVAHNCAEIVLASGESCNLAEVFPAIVEAKGYDIDRILQLALHYTKRVTCAEFDWKITRDIVSQNRRVGVSLSGIRDWMLARGIRDLDKLGPELDRWYQVVRAEDVKFSEALGIPTSVAVTTVKPSGCRPWNALTSTDEGLLTLEELLEHHPEGREWAEYGRAKALHGGGRSASISKTYDNGDAEVFRVKTACSIEFESTGNHRWFVSESYSRGRKQRRLAVGEWVQTQDLQPGDVLEIKPGIYDCATPSVLARVDSRALSMRGDATEIRQPDRMNEDIAWLLGYLWGDGAMSPDKYRLRFTDARRDNLEKAKRVLAEQFGLEAELRAAGGGRRASVLDVGSKHLWHWLIRNDLFKIFAGQIALIPAVVRRSRRSDILAFLAGLIDADGCVSARAGGVNTVIVSTADADFARHLQQVALAAGIVLGRSENASGRSFQKRKSIWNLTSTSFTVAECFDELRSHSVKMRPENIAQPSNRWQHETGSARRILGKVESVDSIGTMPTFDVEVEGEHWYYAGAAKSHNTVSLLNGSSPGLHAHWSPFMIRRVRFQASDPLVDVIRTCGFNVELDAYSPNTVVASFPVAAPNASKRSFVSAGDLTLEEQFDTQVALQHWWSDNSVSATLTFRPAEKKKIPALLREYRDRIKSTSLLPYLDPNEKGAYAQAPYESITKKRYEAMLAEIICWPHEMAAGLHEDKKREFEIVDQADCVSGACPIK